MTGREPFLALRDLRVYFLERGGFLEGLLRREPSYVKAVDGLDLEIGKGEMYCLVGESGCGKTTTGKGILRLVEPTDGDVLLKIPPADLAHYDAARAEEDEETLEAVRRRWSLNYREARHWTPRNWLSFSLAAAAGAVLGGAVAALLVTATDAASLPILSPVAFAALGLILGFLGTYPPVKLIASLRERLLPFAIAGTLLGTLLGAALGRLAAGRSADLGSVGRDLLSRGDLFVIGLLPLQLFSSLLLTWIASSIFIHRRRLRSGAESERIRRLRKGLQMIFQDPYEYLNPKHSVYDIVSEPLLVNRLVKDREETEARVRKALHDAGLRPPEDFLYRYPHELSGGQRQRVAIASALVLEPEFIVADEPVSMLDVSIRTEILETLLELRRSHGLTYLFITHDLSLAWVLADRIGVMYLGRLVEEGPTREVIKNPRHPYTKALISVVPVPDPRRRRDRIVLQGESPDPAELPAGCRFHPRCPAAFERCGWTPEEIAADIRDLARSDGAKAPSLGEIRADGSRLEVATADPSGAEAWLREMIGAKSERHRSLKAIRAVEHGAGELRISLHDFEEPVLKGVAPGVRVACHLVT